MHIMHDSLLAFPCYKINLFKLIRFQICVLEEQLGEASEGLQSFRATVTSLERKLRQSQGLLAAAHGSKSVQMDLLLHNEGDDEAEEIKK